MNTPQRTPELETLKANRDTQSSDFEHQPDLEHQIGQLKEELAAVANTLQETAASQIDEVHGRAGNAVHDLERRVQRDPLVSVAVAAGVGLLIGALISR